MSEGPTIGDWTQYGWIPNDVSSFPARVRLRNAAWMVYYEPDVIDLKAEARLLRRENKELQDENAKLRELVCWMYDRMDESCAVQYPYAPAPISYDRLMQAQARARDLGVEVDA